MSGEQETKIRNFNILYHFQIRKTLLLKIECIPDELCQQEFCICNKMNTTLYREMQNCKEHVWKLFLL